MRLKVLNILAYDNYDLILFYDTDKSKNIEIKLINLKETIFKNDCWKDLRDINLFKQVFVDDFGDGPCWPNDIEMEPISIYYDSILLFECDSIKKNEKIKIIKNIILTNDEKETYI